MTPFPLARHRAAFRASARSFIPALGTASADTWNTLESTVSTALASRPGAMVRQLGLFLGVLDLACRVRYGRSLERANDRQRIRLLQAFERAPVLLVRRGIWGLRTLVMMGYYTQPAVIAGLGYRASPAGWAARR